MSERTEFDDLARRKLEEREFPFDRAAWRDVEARLPERRRRRAGWILGGAVLLLLIPAGLWLTASDADQGTAPATATTTPTRPDTAAPAHEAQLGANDQRATTAAASAAPATTATKNTTASAPAPESTTITASAASRDTEAAPPAQPRSPVRAARPASPATITAPRPETIVSVTATGTNAGVPSDAPAEAQAVPSTQQPPQEPVPIAANDPQPIDTAHTDADHPTEPLHVGPPAIAVDPSHVDPEATVPDGSPASTLAVNATVVAADTTQPASSANAPDPSATTDAHPADAVQPVPATASTDSARTDSTATAQQQTVQDSAATPPTMIQLPTLADPRARWEISAMGGLFATRSNYSGERADAWQSGITGRTTTGFGAEVMHMGPHFGIGLGAHYATYAERISAQRVDHSVTNMVDSNFWDPVDTTILIVLGNTVVDGHTYYIVDTRDTTIHVLRLATVSRTGTALRRAALQRENTWTYLELPLLFDAHTRKGRWAFGVRGGPSLCVLQGRRGVLPNAGLDGYTELVDEPYKELSFGYQARCYVRYQFLDAWSVGLEPTLRGQLPVSIGDSGLSRQASAFGGQLSVSYRLK